MNLSQLRVETILLVSDSGQNTTLMANIGDMRAETGVDDVTMVWCQDSY